MQGVAGPPPGAIAVENGRTRVMIILSREFLRDAGRSLTLRFPPQPSHRPPCALIQAALAPRGCPPCGEGAADGGPQTWGDVGWTEGSGAGWSVPVWSRRCRGMERRKQGDRCRMKAPASSCRLLVTSRVPSAGSGPGGVHSACHPHSSAPQGTSLGSSHGDFQPGHAPLQDGHAGGAPRCQPRCSIRGKRPGPW